MKTPPASEIHEVMKATRAKARRTRDIDLEHDDVTNEFMINGMTWHDVQDANWNVFADEGGTPPKPGDYEIWRIENKSGGWYHPLHIHLVDFQILSRSGGAGRVQPWEKGPKDVVYVGEGEIIEVLVHYGMPPAFYPDGRPTGQAALMSDRGGRYMIHCHNLSHEDYDMMRPVHRRGSGRHGRPVGRRPDPPGLRRSAVQAPLTSAVLPDMAIPTRAPARPSGTGRCA